MYFVVYFNERFFIKLFDSIFFLDSLDLFPHVVSDCCPDLRVCRDIHLLSKLFRYILAEVYLVNMHLHKHIIIKLLKCFDVLLHLFLILVIIYPGFKQRHSQFFQFQIVFLLILYHVESFLIDLVVYHPLHVFKHFIRPNAILFLFLHYVVVACIDASIFEFALS